jgi:excisionase family DNA binding protein
MNRGQEFVIGGYFPGPHGFDSLIVGYYDGGELMYVARTRNGFVPRLLRIQDAAKYLSATTWQIETLLREKKILSFVLGKRRVVDRLELDRYVECRNAEAKTALRDNAASEP